MTWKAISADIHLDRLSTDYRLNIDRLSTKCRPSVDGQSTECRSTGDRVSIECRPSVDRVSIECRPSVDRVSTATSTDIAVDIAVAITYSKHDPMRDQDEGKNGKGLHPRSDVLDTSPPFFRLGSQHQATIEQKLRLWLSLHQVDCQQIAQVDVLARHNLGDKLSWDRRKSGTNNERLVQ